MEMEMRAREEVDIATDITHPIVPLSYCLHDSFLHSHCSSCFSPLPFPPHHHHLSSVFYCSNQCFSSDSSLHFSTAENHLLLLPELPDESSDLRAALRFLHSERLASHSRRIAGLLTNYDKLMSHDDELSQKIRIGARAMAAAIMMQRGCEELDDAVFKDAIAALCLVLTNAVEVHDDSGRTLGIAVYDPNFCWINHSCSPNAIYRFAFCLPNSLPSPSEQLNLRIAPFTRNSQELKVLHFIYNLNSFFFPFKFSKN